VNRAPSSAEVLVDLGAPQGPLVHVPFTLCGARARAGAEVHELRFPNGSRVSIPVLTKAHTDTILVQDRFLLRDVPLQEIVAFLRNVGNNWKSKEYARRRLYVRQLQEHLGYSEKAAELEANWIAMSLASHGYMYDQVTSELGSRQILDGWVRRDEVDLRAYPRGRALHILAGNVPLAGITSILRALLTKNVCVVKAASSDPFTPVALALSFLDVSPQHPVARALSVVSWSRQATGPNARRLLEAADVICAWGAAGAIEWATQGLKADTELLRFGPRRSVAAIGVQAEVETAARALAHDVCVYDQRACFSVQQAFVQGPVDVFVAALQRAMKLYAEILPKGTHDFDEQAMASLALREATFLGASVHSDTAAGYGIVIAPPRHLRGHPLGRTVFVHPVDDIAEIVPFLGPDVQTVAVAPWDLSLRHRDAFAQAGVTRVVELGMANLWRQGGGHDGMLPLQRLVRFVSAEMPASVFPKTMVIPVDQTKFIEEDRFLEFVP